MLRKFGHCANLPIVRQLIFYTKRRGIYQESNSVEFSLSHLPSREPSHVTFLLITSFDLVFDSSSVKHGFFHWKNLILDMREINQRIEWVVMVSKTKWTSILFVLQAVLTGLWCEFGCYRNGRLFKSCLCLFTNVPQTVARKTRFRNRVSNLCFRTSVKLISE